MRKLFAEDLDGWVLPWAILPEVDYLIATRMTAAVARLFRSDLAAGNYHIEWGTETDLERAAALDRRYAALDFGLVDAVVMATSERLEAAAIATLDRRHFGAVDLIGRPRLVP